MSDYLDRHTLRMIRSELSNSDDSEDEDDNIYNLSFDDNDNRNHSSVVQFERISEPVYDAGSDDEFVTHLFADLPILEDTNFEVSEEENNSLGPSTSKNLSSPTQNGQSNKEVKFSHRPNESGDNGSVRPSQTDKDDSPMPVDDVTHNEVVDVPVYIDNVVVAEVPVNIDNEVVADVPVNVDNEVVADVHVNKDNEVGLAADISVNIDKEVGLVADKLIPVNNKTERKRKPKKEKPTKPQSRPNKKVKFSHRPNESGDNGSVRPSQTDKNDNPMPVDSVANNVPVNINNEEVVADEPINNKTKRKSRPKKKKPTDEELGWSCVDVLSQLPTFNEQTGVRADITETSTPLQIFSLFFPESMIRLIKSETNKYAKLMIDKLRRSNKLLKNSVWGKWKTVKLYEVYNFFAIILHMCIVKKPKLSDYWSTDEFLKSSYAPSIMSRDRFFAILANLHISDNATYIPYQTPGHDPMHKIRPYIDHLLTVFPQCIYPSENLTVDEGTCGFRGRVRFRVYNKSKPDKYGMKLYIVCDASTGYVLKFEPYTGKSADNSAVSLFGRLLSEYLGKGHTIYMDRFYSSPILFDFLWSNNTKAVGTCMGNRKQLPKTVTKMKLEQDSIIFMRRKHLLCLKWKDTRDVLLLSTIHKSTTSEVLVPSNEGMKPKTKPDVVIDYNKNKTGVDRNDQIIAYYPFKRKQFKWWKKMFFHLFMMSMTNAFILYRATRPAPQRKHCHMDSFIVSVGKALGNQGGTLFQAEQQSSPIQTKASRLTGRHFPAKIPPSDKKANPTRICKVCSDKAKASSGNRGRKETSWWCAECEVAMCVPDCFQLYHTKADYI